MPGKSPEATGLPPGRDLNTLHANGSASLAELREFLGTLHGKNPQEVIGIVSSSLLAQSLALATVATIVLLALFTVGPYLIYGPPREKQAKKPAPAAAETAAAEPASGETPPAAATADKPGAPDLQQAAKVLGIDEAKPADPQKNPLDAPNLDKLLDGVN